MRVIDAEELRTWMQRMTDFLTALCKATELAPMEHAFKAEIVLFETMLDLVDEMPVVDAEPVVRCKDCKFFCPYEGEEHKGDCAELVGLESCVYEDDYCSYGERKGE